MGKWLTDLVVSDYEGKEDMWILQEDLIYEADSGDIWVIPKRYYGDFASVPRLFWVFFPPTSIRKAPWVHDYIYSERPEGVRRKEADNLLRECMYAEGVGGFKNWAIYTAVRMGGALSWNKNKTSGKRLEGIHGGKYGSETS